MKNELYFASCSRIFSDYEFKFTSRNFFVLSISNYHSNGFGFRALRIRSSLSAVPQRADRPKSAVDPSSVSYILVQSVALVAVAERRGRLCSRDITILFYWLVITIGAAVKMSASDDEPVRCNHHVAIGVIYFTTNTSYSLLGILLRTEFR